MPTLIAGIYGMNFKNMPELDWALGYPLAVAVMLVIDGLSVPALPQGELDLATLGGRRRCARRARGTAAIGMMRWSPAGSGAGQDGCSVTCWIA